MITEVIQQIA